MFDHTKPSPTLPHFVDARARERLAAVETQDLETRAYAKQQSGKLSEVEV
jgi:hypothetical protein